MAHDLLFQLKLLNRSTTKVLSLSDFPEDLTPTRQTDILAQLKEAIEKGDTVLLINSEPLQAPLVILINFLLFLLKSYTFSH